MNERSKEMATDTDFITWMHEVDNEVDAIVGMSVHDLPDQPFRDWFDAGMEPDEAAADALEDAGWSE